MKDGPLRSTCWPVPAVGAGFDSSRPSSVPGRSGPCCSRSACPAARPIDPRPAHIAADATPLLGSHALTAFDRPRLRVGGHPLARACRSRRIIGRDPAPHFSLDCPMRPSYTNEAGARGIGPSQTWGLSAPFLGEGGVGRVRVRALCHLRSSRRRSSRGSVSGIRGEIGRRSVSRASWPIRANA